MTPAALDLPAYVGEDRVYRLTLVGPDGETPLELSGQWAAQTRRSPTASHAVTITVDTSDQAEGVLWLTIPGVEFSRHDAGQWVWDLHGSAWGTILAGGVPVRADVTDGDAGGSVTALVVALGPDKIKVVSAAALGPQGPVGPPGDGIFGVDEEGPYYSLTGAAEGERAHAIIEDGDPVLLVEV